MIFYVDRIEGSRAVLQAQDGRMTEANASMLPESAREGSLLVCAEGRFYPAPALEAERKKRLRGVLDRLPRNGNGQKGD